MLFFRFFFLLFIHFNFIFLKLNFFIGISCMFQLYNWAHRRSGYCDGRGARRHSGCGGQIHSAMAVRRRVGGAVATVYRRRGIRPRRARAFAFGTSPLPFPI